MGENIRNVKFLLLALSVSITAFCYTDASSSPKAEQSHHDIIFVRQPKMDGSMMALGGGKLTLVDRCLRVVNDSDPLGDTIVWPYNFNYRRRDGRVEILNGSNQVVAHVGDEITLVGSEIDLWYPGQGRTSEPGPERCAGPYWVAGSEVKVLKP